MPPLATRTQLVPRGVQVVGVYVSSVDTEMTTDVAAPKVDPGDAVRALLDGIEAGELEVLADKSTRAVRAHLNEPIQAQLARVRLPPVGAPRVYSTG
jgi:hypothetical protein